MFQASSKGEATKQMSFRLGSAENRILAAAAAALQFSSRLTSGNNNDDEDDDIVDNIVIDKCTSATQKKILFNRNNANSSRNLYAISESFDCDGNVEKRLVVPHGNNNVNVVTYTVPLKGGADNDSDGSSRSSDGRNGDKMHADARDDDGVELLDDDSTGKSNQEYINSSLSCGSTFAKDNFEAIMASLATSFQNPCGQSQSTYEEQVSPIKTDSPISTRELEEKLKQLQLQLTVTDQENVSQSSDKYSTGGAKLINKQQVGTISIDEIKYNEFKQKIRLASSFLNQGTGNKNRRKRPLRFEECVTVWQSTDMLSDDEKRDAWYNAKEFSFFQQNDKALARQIRTKKSNNTSSTNTAIAACGLSTLLNDYEECIETFVNGRTTTSPSLDDSITESSSTNECLRGLENWISKQSKLACKGRRKTIVDVVLHEQQNQKKYGIGTSKTNYYDAASILRKQALLVSKVSRVVAKKLAIHDASYVLNVIYPELIYTYPQWKIFLKMKNTEQIYKSNTNDSSRLSEREDSTGVRTLSSKKSFDKYNTIPFQKSPSSLSIISTSSSTAAVTRRRMRSFSSSSSLFGGGEVTVAGTASSSSSISSRGMTTSVPIGKYQQHLKQHQQQHLQQNKNNTKNHTMSKHDLQQLQQIRRTLSSLKHDISLKHPPSISLRHTPSTTSNNSSKASKITTSAASVGSSSSIKSYTSTSSSTTGSKSLSCKPLRKTKSGIRSSTKIYK